MGTAPFGTDKTQINFDKNELNVLYKNFLSMDANKNGFVEPEEFYDLPGMKDNPVVKRVIEVFDKNQDGKISFYEFVWGLSALTSDAKLEEKQRIAFNIYDINGDGFLTNSDLFYCLKMFVGEDSLSDVQVQQLADRTLLAADKDNDGKISYEEFCNFTKDFKLNDLFSMDIFNDQDNNAN